MPVKLPEHYDIELPIRNFVTKRVIGVDINSTVQEAAQRMVEFNVSSLVVLKNDEIVGFFTDGDIKEKIVARGKKPEKPVSEIMNRDLITADIGIGVKDALTMMADKNIKHLLVEEKDEIVGILTFRDLIDIDKHRLETHISRE